MSHRNLLRLLKISSVRMNKYGTGIKNGTECLVNSLSEE